MMTTRLEPKDKLDTVAAEAVAVNGPEGVPDWYAIDWRVCEDHVRRLRQRIFTASQAQDHKRVRNLQKLMLRSRSNTLLAVRRVTEINAGRLTAGMDGRIVLDGQDKAALADDVQRRQQPWQARPVKRVYLPKADGRRRPLGIPVIVDRVMQARVTAAMEPEWEARFEPRSYGFRPGRGCQDAIQAIFATVKGRNPVRRWILDADLKAAFDRIDHHHLLGQLGGFPAREQVADWLTAGVVEQGRFTPTEEGTPQGGVVSPLLLNVALHGMEHAAGVRYRTAGNDGAATAPGSPVLIRYADDFVALCRTRDEAIQVKARLAAWLTPRGLTFNEDKTRVVDLDEGFDFLGFNVRRYHGLLLIKPSKTAVRRIRKRLRTEVRALRGSNAAAVIARLNPIIRGWAAYYRTVVSSEIFNALDHYLWRLVYKWARHSHPNKPTSWVVAHYFGMFNKSRRDRWVFGDRDSGAYLQKFTWTRIVRHQLVPGTASPDDGTDRLLARPTATPEDATPGRPHHPAAARRPAGPVHPLRGLPLARRTPATNPRRMGTVVRRPAESDGPQRHQPTTGRQPSRSATPSAPHLLPSPGNQQEADQQTARQHAIGLA
ncbi:group II intron reverse transcriptase/maturase [Actinoplanes sichuanensis]|uniref:Group II intron reverse transcriptase/maturase n=2 Tax=Actinoplanes sichuanensis TaxID=512349 RepID=A0ABW3ZZB3_9ACTN